MGDGPPIFQAGDWDLAPGPSLGRNCRVRVRAAFFEGQVWSRPTDSPRIVYLVLLIAYASSIWNSIANG
jgi:hypothetical protein